MGTVPDTTRGAPLGPPSGAEGPPALAERFGLLRFAPITYEYYAPEEQALREYERALRA
jgi:hypothetical protein